MCPPPRSLALEANGCFMVQVRTGLTEYKVAVRSVTPERELPSDQDLELHSRLAATARQIVDLNDSFGALPPIRQRSNPAPMRSHLEILIRPARPSDAIRLREVLHDTYESTWLPQVTTSSAQAFRDEDRPALYVAERGAEFWVAEQDGQVVGFVDWDADFVNALHVRSSHARLGIGNRLMDKAEAEIAEAGFSSVRLETDTFNTRSQAFYSARGYRETDRYPDAEWNSGLTTLLLVKALS